MVVRGLLLPGQMATLHCILQRSEPHVQIYLKILMNAKSPVTLSLVTVHFQFVNKLCFEIQYTSSVSSKETVALIKCMRLVSRLLLCESFIVDIHGTVLA